MTALPSLAENPVPPEIPKYDGKPATKDKPVKIYIFSGQSAPPKGHLSVWLEEAKMPPLLLEEVERREGERVKEGK